ncbi:MAG: TetR/AcrR family transcriptional regulator [Deltaproteobacteria bacterium]|nr:TetR/AcrR family transcriptional regulator [Deltaproteobacteria bacterium]
MSERRRLQPEIRRQQILDAAIHLFYQVGFEAASLRDLASRVGINKATIYHYFESKEEILSHIIGEVGQQLLEGVVDAARGPGDPVQVLEAMVRFQIGYLEAHLEGIKVLVEEKKSLRADLRARVRSEETEIFRRYKDVLVRCQEAGTVRRSHLATSAFAILGQINWLYQWYKPDGTLSTGELADEIVAILFRGLLVSDPTSGEGAGR